MKKIKLFLVFAMLFLGIDNASATWMNFTGQSRVTQVDVNLFRLDCLVENKACCTVNFVTLQVIIFETVFNPQGEPTPGTGSVIGAVVAQSVEENPDQQRTLTLEVTDLEVYE